MTRINLLIALYFLLAQLSSAVASENPTYVERPVVRVLSKAKVKGAIVRLGDIAQVKAYSEHAKEVASKLAAVEISAAPAPKTTSTVLGLKILEKIEAAGISREQFAYAIPQAVSIEREGLLVSESMIIGAVRETLTNDPAVNVQVRNVKWDHAHIVPAGKTKVAVTRLGQPVQGRVPLRVVVSVDGESSARFLATATVDDWREVPVVSRPLRRGSLIHPDDIQLVRLNLSNQPADLVVDLNELVGRRIKTSVGAGETLRERFVDIPPMIPRGAAITLRYKIPGFEATVPGIAMDDGHEGDRISVRNTDSRRLVEAQVITGEIAEVR